MNTYLSELMMRDCDTSLRCSLGLLYHDYCIERKIYMEWKLAEDGFWSIDSLKEKELDLGLYGCMNFTTYSKDNECYLSIVLNYDKLFFPFLTCYRCLT